MMGSEYPKFVQAAAVCAAAERWRYAGAGVIGFPLHQDGGLLNKRGAYEQ
jgi:hypothetical protein